MGKARTKLAARDIHGAAGRDRVSDDEFSAFSATLRARRVEVVEYAGLLAAARGRKVVVLGGYSSLGYKDPSALRALVGGLLSSRGDKALYVAGATGAGIGAAYRWIPGLCAELGLKDVKTAGIVSKNACRVGVEDQDFVVFVDTPPGDWSVVVKGKSLMVSIAADAEGEMVYFRGGAIAGDEIAEALARNVRVSIVDGPGTEPDPRMVDAMRALDAEFVADGTSMFLEACARQSGGMDLRRSFG